MCPSCRMFIILFCDVSGMSRVDPFSVIIWPSGKSLMSRFSIVCLNSFNVAGSFCLFLITWISSLYFSSCFASLIVSCMLKGLSDQLCLKGLTYLMCCFCFSFMSERLKVSVGFLYSASAALLSAAATWYTS